MVKARSVPMETSSPKTPMGRTPAMKAAMSPVITVVMWGVPNLGCNLAKPWGRRPSLAMEKKIRGWPIIITRMTELRPAMAPI